MNLVLAAVIALQPMVLTVQRTTSGGAVESFQVAFGPERVRIVSNSNFLDAPSTKGRIGVLSAPMSPLLRTEWGALDLLSRRVAREAKLARDQVKTSRHGLRWSLGKEQLPSGSPYARALAELIQRLPGEAAWQKEETAEAALVARETRVRVVHESPAGRRETWLERCESQGKTPSGEKLSCAIAPLGTVYLLR